MNRKKAFLMVTTFFLVILLDQSSKTWIVQQLDLYESRTIADFLLPYLQITRTSNTGVAFGIGEGANTIFLLLSAIISGVLLTFYWRSQADDSLSHVAYGLVLGGAIGNAIDRLQYGYVVDFVHVQVPNLISNASNFADHAIVIGVLLLLLDTYLQEQRSKQALLIES